MRTGGQLLIDSLINQGVTTVFGIPGVQLDAATDALHDVTDRIRFVCARNEQATTYMADGYARSTGDVGVAMVVPGPGVLNALAGLATAYATNSRVLLIAGQIDSHGIGKGHGALHELPDQSGVLQRLTKWSGLARSADDVPELVTEAFRRLRSGRPQPVALEVPPDVLASMSSVTPAGLVNPHPLAPDAAAVERLAAIVSAARRPVIYVGGGVIASGGGAALTALAEELHAPVVVSENGRGAIDARHTLAFDALALRTLRSESDLVLAVGTRFMTTFGTPISTGGAPLALLNVQPADLAAPRDAVLAVEADARLGLEALASGLGRAHRTWEPTELAQVRAYVESEFDDIAAQKSWLHAIRAALPDDGVLVSEFTQIGYAASACFPTYHQRGYIGPGYQGTLGFGFATSLGVKAADPARAVISINGDGGFSWTLPELSTAKRFGLGVRIVIFNDGYFGNVRRIQKNNYNARYFASDLTNPDYRQLANAFSVGYATAAHPLELEGILRDTTEERQPIIVEVPVGEFPSPWHLIHEGLARPAGADGKISDE